MIYMYNVICSSIVFKNFNIIHSFHGYFLFQHIFTVGNFNNIRLNFHAVSSTCGHYSVCTGSYWAIKELMFSKMTFTNRNSFL